MRIVKFLIAFDTALLLSFMGTGCTTVTEYASSAPQANVVTDSTGQERQLDVKDQEMVVHVDPTTGKIIAPPQIPLSGEALKAPEAIAKTPLPVLQQTLSPILGGGVVIHLDERFMTPLTATIDAGGKVRIEHQQTTSDLGDKK